MEVRLEVIAADMVMDSTDPVLQVEDVPMKRFEVRSLGTVFNVVPFARQGTQVTFPSVRSHNGRSFNGRFQDLLERLSRSIFNHSSTASLQLRFPSRHVAVIDFNRHQHEAFAARCALASLLHDLQETFRQPQRFQQVDALPRTISSPTALCA